MRKIAKYLVAAMGMVAAVACNKEFSQEVRPEQNGNSYTFTATIGVETKTVLDGMKSRWMGDADGNEYIHVLDNEGNRDTYVAAGITEPTDNAVFTFSGEEATITGNSVVAIYPSIYGDEWVPTDAIAEEGFHSVKVIYKSDQAAVENSYDPQGPVAMAYIDDLSKSQSFSFKNMSALLKFSLAADSDPVDNVTLYIPNGGNGVLSGTVIITEENGEYTFEGDVNPQGWVALNGKIEPGKTYYIAVVPGTVDGLTFQMNKDADQEVTINREITFERNRIYDLGSSFSYTEQDLNLGLIGAFNNWNAPDVKMTLLGGGMYAAYNVALEGDFKIRGNESWDEGNPNYGLNVAGTITAGYYYYVTDGGQNATIEAGTYDVYLDVKSYKLYVVNAGESIDGLTEGEVVLPPADEWYLVGNFNGWTAGDANYKMTYENGWYVFKGFAADGQGVKFNAGSWTVNRGGTWAAVNEAISLTQDGKDITVPAGTYDVYLNSTFDAAYFMTPGQKPSAQPSNPTPSDAWYIVGSFNSWTAVDPNYAMTKDGDWWTITADFVENEEVKFVGAAGWGDNFGSSEAVVSGQQMPLSVDGNNIMIPAAGTYEVKLNTTIPAAVFTLLPPPTPDKKQWLTTNADLQAVFELEATFCFDLGVAVYESYAMEYLVLGVNYEDIYGPDAAGMWMSTNSLLGEYTVTATDATSGVIVYQGAEIPYSDFTGTECTFDFTNIFGISDVKCTLAEEFIPVMVQ
ncbi:MAG: hypothetical protein IJZ70_06195 [Bacteroidales bacterium]|nr:hypothetical protein [Bacteroidales bacterium]